VNREPCPGTLSRTTSPSRGPIRFGSASVESTVTLPPDASVTADELRAFCREHMARFKVPKNFVFRELPKTSTGKIQKFVLRELAKSASAIE